ncbi:cytosolic phospholipase A2 zeta [Ophiocordyceps camponoti-floridani]|uniref:Lysophospholipase n=1 Tax=Ophiocordyceps camponoti-floridani TaxID=2030778 RepID=A0A8H4Q6F8_9HYPO|nr:cytosolic phospholipase A2 zeta [Ophiocordyceps camponoti-floridani]
MLWRIRAQAPRPVRVSLLRGATHRSFPRLQQHRGAHSTNPKSSKHGSTYRLASAASASLVAGGLFIWWLYPSDDFTHLSVVGDTADTVGWRVEESRRPAAEETTHEISGWANFARRFESLTLITDVEWTKLSEQVFGSLLPEWSKLIPSYVKKLRRELSMSPGSLAEEIWQEAHDPHINPEIRYSARVRVSNDLCDEEKQFLARRRAVVRAALAKYLDLEEADIHPSDIPTIATCGSGGGLRALIAGTGSLLAAEEDGLLDCVTYTSGVSGSCWLQALYLSSIAKGSMSALLNHVKARAATHIAYPPVAFHSLLSLPTSKHLLSGLVEKLVGDGQADFGLVDVYGLLLGARYLVPRGELGVNERDFKLSNQQDFVKLGQRPLPIYTAVRHEIPELEEDDVTASAAEEAKDRARREAWFQWYEFTPYEFFCEEFGAGIPTWAVGRRFSDGEDVPLDHGFHLPEIRMPLLMGIFGSAFCATLSHYYREIRPLVLSLSGFGAVDDMVSGKNDDLSKVHPIDPASIPNFAYQMQGKLPKTTPKSIYEKEYIQLMDAGMSNNLPIYPLLRPGRQVDILIAFDASADIKTDNWLSVADGYARQRGVKGWPVGIGWPQGGQLPEQMSAELAEAQASTTREAEHKLREAKAAGQHPSSPKDEDVIDQSDSDSTTSQAGDLGYCTVWVGTTHERSSEPPPPPKAITDADSWKLMDPEAGIAVVYLPFLGNGSVPDVSPGSSDFLSTWNFVYTPDQIDAVVRLARANYDEGRDQIKATIRAVYERKRQRRRQAEKKLRDELFSSIASRSEAVLLGEGDQFS